MGNQIRQIGGFSNTSEELRRQIHKARVTKLSVLKYVPIIGGQMKARTKKDDIGRVAVLAIHEFADRRGGQIGLLFEFGRKKSVKGFVVQRFIEEEFSDWPIFVPIGSFVRRIIEHKTVRVESLSLRVMIQNLVDDDFRHEQDRPGWWCNK